MKQSSKRSVPASKPIRKRYWFAAFSGNALLITLLLHVVFGVAAAYFIIEHFQKKPKHFIAAGPMQQQNEVEHKVQLQKKNTVESAPQDLKRIVSTDVSTITLPDQPDIPPPDDATPTTMDGVGGNGLEGMGPGSGPGGPGGPGGDGNPFGDDTAPPQPAFAGTFYDFKQDTDHHPTNMDVKTEQALLKTFLTNDWDEPRLKRDYLSSSKQLYSNEILIPFQSSSNGPAAFGLQSVCQMGYWCIVYHATVTPTRSGDFRLAGYGDDFLIVRINGVNLLDSGYYPPVTDLDRTKSIPHGPWVNDNSNRNSPTYGAAVEGPQFRITAGDEMTIDVLISDANPAGGTGRCGYFLMLLEADKDYTAQDAQGNYILPLLQINSDPNVKRTGEFPPFTSKAEDALVSQGTPVSGQ